MPDKGGLQLLPETRHKIDVKIPGQNRPVIYGTVLLALVLAIYGGLYAYNTSLDNKIGDVDAQIISLNNKRDKASEKSLLTLSKQMSITGLILQNHIFWSTAFSKLEAKIVGSVQVRSFSASATANAVHIISWADKYSVIAQQLAAYADADGITDINLDSVNTLTSGKLSFNTKLSFDQSKFLKK